MAYAVITPDGDVSFELGIPDTDKIQELVAPGFSSRFLEQMQVRIINEDGSAYLARADVWVNDQGIHYEASANVNLVATRLCKKYLGANAYIHGTAVVVGRAIRGGDTVTLSPLIQERIVEVLGEQ